MAKKGGVQQLQTEVSTNEELTKFLDRDGLIVLDVFTEWCGPCLAMVGTLKKLKLEQGGDDLHLAVVKCDKIDVFARFRNKSEPTWLLASKGKLVNSAFGANVPFLVDLILKELDIERRTRDTDLATSGRAYYELHVMTPVEQKRFDIIQKAEEENERIEQESALKRRIEYLTSITDKIMHNANDMGVTIIAHAMNRDLLKRLTEQADKCRLVAKDKKNIQVLSEHAEILALCSTETMPKRFLEYISNRDIFAVCWKLTDSNVDGDKNVEEYIQNFVQLVWSEEVENSSVLRAISIVVDAEPDDCTIDDENGIESETATVEKDKQESTIEKKEEENEEAKDDEQEGDQKKEAAPEQEMEQEQGEKQEEIEPNGNADKTNGSEQSREMPTGSSESEKKRTNAIDMKKAIKQTMSSILSKNKIEIKIPPIWTPTDKRVNAALIYLYFRSLTELYLPPDPPVERPHIAMIFDAYKRREIMDVIEQYRDEILAYGYFTTDNYETAQLIANSTFNYHKNPPTIHDKFILKVSKVRNSPAIVALKKLGPSYVSKNSEIGKTECLAFFPPGFKNSSETGAPTPTPIDETQKKKKKKKRKTKHDSDDENEIDSNQTQNVTQTATDVETTEEPEDGELDDDDSADDEDSTNEVNETENAAAETATET